MTIPALMAAIFHEGPAVPGVLLLVYVSRAPVRQKTALMKIQTMQMTTLILAPSLNPMSQPAAIEPSPQIIIPDPSMKRLVDPLDR